MDDVIDVKTIITHNNHILIDMIFNYNYLLNINLLLLLF